jgi:DNA repair exonuclease SbcCD nuclease subunit
MLKVLHTADIHLGREFPFLREKGREYRNQLLTTFDLIIDSAINANAPLVLVAGDLFDTNRVYGVITGRVLAAFERLEAKGIQVCILPGTHDAYNDDSIYRFVHFPTNVTVFTPELDHKIYEDLDLTVYGKAFDSKSFSKSPIQGLSLTKESKFHIGLAHCSIKIEGLVEKDTMILDRNEIANSGFDYLALGHWHSFQDFSQGSVKAFYCGSPEPVYMDQKGAGSIVLVTIHEKGDVRVEPIRVGSKRFDTVTIDVGLMKSVEDITKIVTDKADPNLILQVTLEGLSSMDFHLNPQEIEDRLGDLFFVIRVIDKSHSGLEEVRVEDFPEETVIGKFVRIMEQRIATANQDDKELYQEALKLGVALLQGHPQVIE